MPSIPTQVHTCKDISPPLSFLSTPQTETVQLWSSTTSATPPFHQSNSIMLLKHQRLFFLFFTAYPATAYRCLPWWFPGVFKVDLIWFICNCTSFELLREFRRWLPFERVDLRKEARLVWCRNVASLWVDRWRRLGSHWFGILSS